MNEQKTVKRGRGRPATYANAAERAKAWRKRQKMLIAQATASVAIPKPVIIEKIVERPVCVPSPKAARGSKPLAQASKLVPVLQERLTGLGAEERAKAMRANTARVATAARDLLELLGPSWLTQKADSSEKKFLEQVEQFFLSLNSSLKTVQRDAKATSAKHTQEIQRRHELRLIELTVKTFGENPSLGAALTMANDLLMFEKDAKAWLVQKLDVDYGHFAISNSSYEIKQAIRTNDLKTFLHAVAEARNEVGERGRSFTYQGQRNFAAGWAEFEEWRCRRNGPTTNENSHSIYGTPGG